MRVGDRVVMVDRFRGRLGGKEPSWFDGMRGTVTRVVPSLLVHLDGERLPMVFDERDFVLEAPLSTPMTGAE